MIHDHNSRRDFKNQLAIIRGSAEVLLAEAAAGEPSRRESRKPRSTCSQPCMKAMPTRRKDDRLRPATRWRGRRHGLRPPPAPVECPDSVSAVSTYVR